MIQFPYLKLKRLSEMTLSGLTASRLVSTDANKKLTSSDLVSWITGTANEVDITDDGDGTITIGLINPLIVSKGGSGAASLTDHGILLGSGTDAITALGAATNGQIPIGSTGADPVLATITGTANQIIVTNAAGTITLSGPQDLHTGAGPTFGGLLLSAAVDATPALRLLNTSTSAVGPIINFDKTPVTLNADDYLTMWNFYATGPGGQHSYGHFHTRCVNVGDGTEIGRILWSTSVDGVAAGAVVAHLVIYNGKVGICDFTPAEELDVTGNANVTGVYKVDDVQVISNRVIDARCDDAVNSGDATTDGVIDALRDAMITHGLIAAA